MRFILFVIPFFMVMLERKLGDKGSYFVHGWSFVET